MSQDILGLKGYGAIIGTVTTTYSWVQNVGIAITAMTGFLTMILVIYSLVEKRKNIKLIEANTENLNLENQSLKDAIQNNSRVEYKTVIKKESYNLKSN